MIINSVSPTLDLSKGYGSHALLKSGGESIQVELETNYSGGIQEGEIAETDAGQLSCQKIYHVGISSKWTPDGSKEQV